MVLVFISETRNKPIFSREFLKYWKAVYHFQTCQGLVIFMGKILASKNFLKNTIHPGRSSDTILISRTSKTPISVSVCLNKINSRVKTKKVDENSKKTKQKYCNVLFYHNSIQHHLNIFSIIQVDHVYNNAFVLNMGSLLYSLVPVFAFW